MGAAVSAIGDWISNAESEPCSHAHAQSHRPPSYETPILSQDPFSLLLQELDSGNRKLAIRGTHERIRPCLQAMVDSTPCFMPMEHVHDMLPHMIRVTYSAFIRSETPRSLLITGPKGIGKSKLLTAFCERSALGSFCKPSSSTSPRSRVIPLYISLDSHTATDEDSFYSWLFAELVSQLSADVDADEELLRYLKGLAVLTARNAPFHLFDLHDAGFLPPMDSTTETGRLFYEATSQKYRFPVGALNVNYISFLDFALKAANFSLLVIVDEVEAVFQGKFFSRRSANVWNVQMQHITTTQRFGVALIMCASFQRAGQLFLGASQNDPLPDAYTHLFLISDWNATKLEHVQMEPPRWTVESLTEFTLVHSLDAANADTPAKRLKEAARLDGIFLQPSGDAPVYKYRLLEEALENVLAAYGHSPRSLSRGIISDIKEMKPPCTFALQSEESPKAISKQVLSRAQRSFEAYMHVLKTQKPNLSVQTHLNFNTRKFAVESHAVLMHMQCGEEYAGADGSSPPLSQQSARREAFDCFHAALDLGYLVLVGDHEVAACDAGEYMRFICNQSVSGTVFRRMRHCYAERAELCVARALARSKMFSSRKYHVLTGDHGETSNFDTAAGSLSSLHVVALAQDNSLLVARSVHLSDMQRLLKIWGLQQLTHSKNWNSLLKFADSKGIAPRAVAAFMACVNTSPGVLSKLSRLKHFVWLKESPGALGGDLIGICFIPRGQRLHVYIHRVQVTLASQASLLLGSGSNPSKKCVYKALCNFLGTASISAIRPGLVSVRHEPACLAIEDLIRASTMEASISDPHKWFKEFELICCVPSVVFHWARPVIATTHVPSSEVRATAKLADVRLLDGKQLKPHWGPLGKVCQSLGVRLVPKLTALEAAAESGSGSSSATGSQEYHNWFLGPPQSSKTDNRAQDALGERKRSRPQTRSTSVRGAPVRSVRARTKKWTSPVPR